MKKILGVLILSVLLTSLVLSQGASNLAQDNSPQIRTEIKTRVTQNISDMDLGEVRKMAENQIRVRKMAENQIRVRKMENNFFELESNQTRIRTSLKLQEGENNTQLQIQLSNGRKAQIKIMPEVASKRAIERLRLKACNKSSNCTIELREVGSANQTKAVYEARATKEFRILGLFKTNSEVMTQIDAETGEEISTKRPWWAWMASEEKADELKD